MANVSRIAGAHLLALQNRSSIHPSLRLPDGLDTSGLYAWFVDVEGASQLTQGLQSSINPSIIYAGQAGATKWPSGIRVSQTLKGRLEGNHIRGKQRSSTFRRTLNAILQFNDEQALTVWMQAHLALATFCHEERDTLMALEHSVISDLDPPLNLQGMAASQARKTLSALRKDQRAAQG
jgi:hypothetical protein